jgi:hypothetical protein
MNSILVQLDLVPYYNREQEEAKLALFAHSQDVRLAEFSLKSVLIDMIRDQFKTSPDKWMHPADMETERLFARELRDIADEYDQILNQFDTRL